MKSIIVEASSIAKAVEQGWQKAGQPKEFSIKVFQEAQKNMFGLTKESAKIGFFFDDKSIGSKIQSATPVESGNHNQPTPHKAPARHNSPPQPRIAPQPRPETQATTEKTAQIRQQTPKPAQPKPRVQLAPKSAPAHLELDQSAPPIAEAANEAAVDSIVNPNRNRNRRRRNYYRNRAKRNSGGDAPTDAN